MTDVSTGRNEAECFHRSARCLLRDAGHHLPLTLPDFSAGVFVIVQLCPFQLQATLCGARFGLPPLLEAQKIFLCCFGQELLEGVSYPQLPSLESLSTQVAGSIGYG